MQNRRLLGAVIKDALVCMELCYGGIEPLLGCQAHFLGEIDRRQSSRLPAIPRGSGTRSRFSPASRVVLGNT